MLGLEFRPESLVLLNEGIFVVVLVKHHITDYQRPPGDCAKAAVQPGNLRILILAAGLECGTVGQNLCGPPAGIDPDESFRIGLNIETIIAEI